MQRFHSMGEMMVLLLLALLGLAANFATAKNYELHWSGSLPTTRTGSHPGRQWGHLSYDYRLLLSINDVNDDDNAINSLNDVSHRDPYAMEVVIVVASAQHKLPLSVVRALLRALRTVPIPFNSQGVCKFFDETENTAELQDFLLRLAMADHISQYVELLTILYPEDNGHVKAIIRRGPYAVTAVWHGSAKAAFNEFYLFAQRPPGLYTSTVSEIVEINWSSLKGKAFSLELGISRPEDVDMPRDFDDVCDMNMVTSMSIIPPPGEHGLLVPTWAIKPLLEVLKGKVETVGFRHWWRLSDKGRDNEALRNVLRHLEAASDPDQDVAVDWVKYAANVLKEFHNLNGENDKTSVESRAYQSCAHNPDGNGTCAKGLRKFRQPSLESKSVLAPFTGRCCEPKSLVLPELAKSFIGNLYRTVMGA